MMKIATLAILFTMIFPMGAKECASQETSEFALATLEKLDDKVQQAYLAGASGESILATQAAANLKVWEAVAGKGNASAQYLCGVCSQLGVGTQKDYEQANEWFRKAAEQNHAGAMLKYGLSFVSSMRNKQDHVAKLKWLRKAQDLGSADAIDEIGTCYFHGMGVPQDQEEGIRLIRVAADRGSANAKNTLGICLLNGTGVEVDTKKAISLIREAANQGYGVAQNTLGTMYYMGDGINKDYAEAVKWFRKAAEQGMSQGQLHLAMCYQKGNGVKKDLDEARIWYTKAADQGFQQAKAALDELGHSALETKHLSPLKRLIVAKVQAKQRSLQNMKLRAYAHATSGTGLDGGSIKADASNEVEAKHAIENYVKKNKSEVLAALTRLANNKNDQVASEASQLIRSADWPAAVQEKKR